MKTSVKARNLELSERLRNVIERKLRRLDRITHPESEATVELIANASHANTTSHVAEVTLITNGNVLRSVSAGSSPMAAFDVVLDKLERQVIRTKRRPRSVRERSADEAGEILAREAARSVPDDGTDEAAGASVVKLKRFDMVPMFEEDAIARIEELGHAFFVFLNAETDAVSILYRRRDGNYGVIEPVVERAGGRGSPGRSVAPRR